MQNNKSLPRIKKTITTITSNYGILQSQHPFLLKRWSLQYFLMTSRMRSTADVLVYCMRKTGTKLKMKKLVTSLICLVFSKVFLLYLKWFRLLKQLTKPKLLPKYLLEAPRPITINRMKKMSNSLFYSLPPKLLKKKCCRQFIEYCIDSSLLVCLDNFTIFSSANPINDLCD